MAKALELYFSKDNKMALEHFNIILKQYYKEITIEKLAAIYFYIANINGNLDNSETSIEYYKKVIELNPRISEAHNNLGNRLIELSKKNIINKKKYLEQAIKEYQLAIEINPDYSDPYNNWGHALLELADIKKSSSEKEEFINQAIQKFKKATELKPEYYIAFSNWAIGLSNLASIQEDIIKKEELYRLAIEKCKTSINIKSDYHIAFSNWGLVLLNLAKIKIGAEKESLLEEAKEKCERVIALGGSCYNLACVYVHQNKKEDAFEWLKKSLERKDISFDHVSKDDDWDNYRNEQEYVQLKKKYLVL